MIKTIRLKKYWHSPFHLHLLTNILSYLFNLKPWLDKVLGGGANIRKSKYWGGGGGGANICKTKYWWSCRLEAHTVPMPLV